MPKEAAIAGDEPISPKDRARALESHKATIKAAERMHRIVQARKHLMPFVHLMMPDPTDPDDISLSRYDEAKFHTILAQQLEKVEAGKALRTIITLPPGHGKSELAAKKYIPWYLGRDPYRKTIFASYSDAFSMETGASVRDTIISNIYQQVFPGCRLAKGSTSKSSFKTTQGGESIFVGIGGKATGKRGDVIIIDDPIKNREEADNPLVREKLWKWFWDVAMTRLNNPLSSVIIIQTRWHEDDLVGRLTDKNNDFFQPDTAKQWEVFEIPAIAEEGDPYGRKEGEPLWAEKWDLEMLNTAKRSNPRGFESLFQGKPSPADGDFFKAHWIKTYLEEDLPSNLRLYCASDHAVSTKQGSDYTCLIPFGVDPYNNIWILPDVWWERAATDKVVEAMLLLMQIHEPLIWTAENGHISKSIGPFLRKRMADTDTYCNIQELTPSKDKVTRAQSISARMSMGKVLFPRFAAWRPKAEAEMLKFPGGKHDDFVDALAWVGITMGQQYGGAVPDGKQADKEPPVGSMAWIKRSEEWEKRQRSELINDGY